MDLSIAGIALALFLVLPGYLAKTLELWVLPGGDSFPVGDWIAMSILGSLVLNAIALPLWLAYTGLQIVPWDADVTNAWKIASSSFKLREVASYLVSLYGLAIFYGLTVGTAVKQWKGLAWALRWKSTRADSV